MEMNRQTAYYNNIWCPSRYLYSSTVNGKECCFEIEELSEEERGILDDRLDSSEEQDATGYPIADATDIDPTTTYGLIFNR